MFLTKKWGILIKKESKSLDFTGLEIPRDYNMVKEEHHKNNDITFISYDTDAEEKIDVKNGVISKELSETVNENLYLMNSEEISQNIR